MPARGAAPPARRAGRRRCRGGRSGSRPPSCSRAGTGPSRRRGAARRSARCQRLLYPRRGHEHVASEVNRAADPLVDEFRSGDRLDERHVRDVEAADARGRAPRRCRRADRRSTTGANDAVCAASQSRTAAEVRAGGEAAGARGSTPAAQPGSTASSAAEQLPRLALADPQVVVVRRLRRLARRHRDADRQPRADEVEQHVELVFARAAARRGSPRRSRPRRRPDRACRASRRRRRPRGRQRSRTRACRRSPRRPMTARAAVTGARLEPCPTMPVGPCPQRRGGLAHEDVVVVPVVVDHLAAQAGESAAAWLSKRATTRSMSARCAAVAERAPVRRGSTASSRDPTERAAHRRVR